MDNRDEKKFKQHQSVAKKFSMTLTVLAVVLFIVLLLLGWAFNNKSKAANTVAPQWQAAGVASHGYQKPGAAIAMRYSLAEALLPNAANTLTTRWQATAPMDRFVIKLLVSDGLTVDDSRSFTIDNPVVGQPYTLNIAFSAIEGSHTIGFTGSSHQADSTQVRSFAVAIETNDAAVRTRNSVSSNEGELLKLMVPSPL